ncbi:hydrolase [Acetobacter orientalis]|uniref:HAD family hydrolase n=1 Tax=Acetobacter orientalis TaxID=146474 RepID=UPI00241E6E8F|nr:hydrolase [Acetobacter orientalis]
MLSHLKQSIAQADAVSFDVFDTLFVRPLAEPEDLFDVLGEKFGIASFRHLRQEAQVRAFQRMRENGQREITLDGIYACFDSVSVPTSVLRDAEYQLELALTLPNPDLMDVFRQTITDKPVVITSDMYLPRAFFDDLFRKHRLRPSAIFISSERNATKRDTGELFDHVSQELGIDPGRILHIGDNLLSDVERAKQKGLSAYHYVDPTRQQKSSRFPPSASIASTLIRSVADRPPPGSFTELGFRFGGPAAVGFLDWIVRKSAQDKIDIVLFISRDGYILERLAYTMPTGTLPCFTYFMGSRVAFTLAATDESNFNTQMEFFLAGAHGLRPIEVLERLGVTPPADRVMDDLGLGAGIIINNDNIGHIRDFVGAFRGEILKVCRRNRRGLLNYLKQVGVEPGMRVAMVDVGWNGTTQDAFDLALGKLMQIELFGYYLCLNESHDCRRRQQRLKMDALLSRESIGLERVTAVYTNRVAVELFFSAPHDAVIGYQDFIGKDVGIIEDPGRIAIDGHAQISTEITDGIEQFALTFRNLCNEIDFIADPLATALPVIDFVESISVETRDLLASVENFDAWGSTRNQRVALTTYLS